MWSSETDFKHLDSEDENVLSSEEEQDIQCEILENQRDEANQRLSQMEEASTQLLKEINLLEIQFQIERSCRETAEALALKVTKDNKVLKRKSQALLPLIPELPENLAALNLDIEDDPASDHNTLVDLAEDPLLKSQAQIKELQSSIDQLLGEKMQLREQVDILKKEKEELKEELAVEVQGKEAILRKLTKQNRTVNKIKRVSQLVTEEFAEIAQKLEMEQGLRHHAEEFAHQVMVKQKQSQRQSVALVQNEEVDLQLKQALEQVGQLSKALEELRLHYQHQRSQSQAELEEFNALAELQMVRAQLETNMKEKLKMDNQLKDSQNTVTALQEEVKQLQDVLKMAKESPVTESRLSNEEKITPAPLSSTPPPPFPPPPTPPPPPSLVSISSTDPLNALRNRKKKGNNTTDSKKPAPSVDLKARAVDEMMERIKKGIVLKPTKNIPQSGLDEDSWTDQRSEKRKSAVLELQGILDTIKKTAPKRMASRKWIGRNVGEVELQMVLQRRRRAIGDDVVSPPISGPKAQDPSPASTATSSNLLTERGNAPVLRRLKQNQEKRNSRIGASECIIWEDK